MHVPRFALEDCVAAHKASCRYSMGSSDVEPLSMQELLDEADGDLKRSWSELSLSYGSS